MKKTAVAPANIAFIKYWGKKDNKLRLPLNSSLSMNLSDAYTTTTVDFSPDYSQDTVIYKENGKEVEFDPMETLRVTQHLDRIRSLAGSSLRAKVITANSFPKCSGVASSASGFAALSLAASSALNLSLPEKQLSILARLGSGSACRSIPDGFVIWDEGVSGDDSFARVVFPAEWWDLRDILCVVDSCTKETPTSNGMDGVKTSPFWQERMKNVAKRIKMAEKSIRERNFPELGRLIEEDCVEMHAVMMTQNPPIYYWNWVTMNLIHSVRQWRDEGIEVYFTIDAGANIHLITESKNEAAILKHLKDYPGIVQTIVNRPSTGARLVDDHLF